MRRRPLIVGQAPGPERNAEPLRGRCGRRLAALCGLDEESFHRRFECVNLIGRHPGKLAKGDAFPVANARRGAVEVLMRGMMLDRPAVLLGNGVAEAFGLDPAKVEKLRLLRVDGVAPLGLALCPHPSGVNRWWNEPANVESARRFWRRLARESQRH